MASDKLKSLKFLTNKRSLNGISSDFSYIWSDKTDKNTKILYSFGYEIFTKFTVSLEYNN